jgi:hypothetical protein
MGCFSISYMKLKLTEDELNEKGNELARILGMKRERKQVSNRIRWKTDWGSKTGLGLLRTIKANLPEMD